MDRSSYEYDAVHNSPAARDAYACAVEIKDACGSTRLLDVIIDDENSAPLTFNQRMIMLHRMLVVYGSDQETVRLIRAAIARAARVDRK